MNELLIELKNRLNQISITGLKSAHEDFRLKKIYEKLQLLSQKAPVFSKISEFILALLNNKEKTCENFLNCVNLVNAVLYTQGISSSSKPKKEIEFLEHTEDFIYLTYSQLKNIRNILKGGTNSIWPELKKAYNEKNLIDYRLLEDFIKYSDYSTYIYKEYNYYYTSDLHNYIEGFSIVTILSAYGNTIIPILFEKYDTATPTGKVNILKTISNIGKQKYNDYYKKIIDEEENDNLISEAIKSLKYNKDNEEFLLSIKSKKKKIQQSRLIALAGINTKTSKNEVMKKCISDVELFKSIFYETDFISEQELISLIKTFISEIEIKTNNIQKGCLDKENLTKEKLEHRTKLEYLSVFIDCTNKFNSENILHILIEIIEKGEILDNCTEKSLLNLFYRNDMKTFKYILNINDELKNNYPIIQFLSAINIFTKEEIFEKFSSLVLKKDDYFKLTISDIIIELLKLEINPNNSKYFYNIYLDNYFKNLNENLSIQWDKRWFEYCVKNNSIKLSYHFLNVLKSELSREYIKETYIDYLKNINNSYDFKYTEKYNNTVYNVQSLLLNLIKMDYKNEAIDNIVWLFSNTKLFNDLKFLTKDNFCDYITNEDIQSIEKKIKN